MAGLFALHGLSTPGMILGRNSVTPLACQLAMIAFAASMVAAAYLRPVEARGPLLRLLAAWVGSIVVLDVVLMLSPDLARFVPVHLGKALALPPEELRALAQAGVVHDVGKIEVPDAILNKQGKLEPLERALINQHPANGERIGRTLGLHRLELEVTRHHHERWDGSGYPDGLAGTYPLLARIMAVADVYDAETSARAYQPARNHEEARSPDTARARCRV